MLLDAFNGHLTPEIKATLSSMNLNPVVITSGNVITVAFVRCFGEQVIEDHLKQLYSLWLLEGEHTLTPAGRIENPGVTVLCQQITMAWQHISPQITVKAFKDCCVEWQ
jgi:hypothetical protein